MPKTEKRSLAGYEATTVSSLALTLIDRSKPGELELKGKLAEGVGEPAGGRGGADVVHALVALGYSEKEALAAVKGLAPDMPLAEAIRAALKTLVRR